MNRRTWLVAALAPMGLALGAGTTSVAAGGPSTIVVSPGHSIQAAIDAAHSGDTILVKPGTYRENLLITKNDLTLRAIDTDDPTLLLPPTSPTQNLCAVIDSGTSGICIVGTVDNSGDVVRDVDNVHIDGFTIHSFTGSGVFGYGTDGLQVTHTKASNDGGYGISRFTSTRTLFRDDVATGNAEAGFYVGDSPDADTVVTDNRASGNGYGIFVRHSREVDVTNNDVFSNCLGIFVLDDGQPGGTSDVLVANNDVHANNAYCPAGEEGPALSGGGIVLVGAVRSVVKNNDVDRNDSNSSVASGGIVVVSAAPFTGGQDASNDRIIDNSARWNLPADILYDGSGHGDVFSGNQCGTSQPPGLC